MKRVVRCTCGVEVRSSDEAELVGRVQRHATEAHDLRLDDEQVRAMMEIDQQNGSGAAASEARE
jgi:predicted small metal-binding protein